MKKRLVHMLVLCLLSAAVPAYAGPDLFIGDAALYSSGNGPRPNILLVLDNSAGMTQKGGGLVYNPATTYRGSYTPDAVYVRVTATGGTINYNLYISSVNSVTCAPALVALKTGDTTVVPNTDPPGAYYGLLKKDGTCSASQSGSYYRGNLLNYLAGSAWVANTSYSLGDTSTVGGVTYQCTQAGTTGSTQPSSWPTTVGGTVMDNTVQWTLPNTATIQSQVQDTLKKVIEEVRGNANIGLAMFGDNNHGAKIYSPIQDISDGSTASQTNYANLLGVVDGMILLNANAQPVNEALWDAGVYYRGQNNSSTAKISSDTVAYPSPISAGLSCQRNLVIVITTGSTPDTTQTKGRLTDLDGGCSSTSPFYVEEGQGGDCKGDAVDASMYNYNQNAIQTNVIQLLTAEVPMLRRAAASTYDLREAPTGSTLQAGQYYLVKSATDLRDALGKLMVGAIVEANSSFVAPVVPVSPENRTYSGSRVYMGFFKPQKAGWHGNLKKYGITAQGSYLVDKNGNQACYVDSDGNGTDDVSGAQLPSGAINGTFLAGSTSYWNNVQDVGVVDSGGAGQVLHDTVYPNRTIYTYTGTSPNLYDASNLFATTNSALTPALLGTTSADRNDLISFMHGQDVYDESNTNSTGERAWPFGDILHSRPYVVSYRPYAAADENNCSQNRSVIYVGANDGMLHAIRDCDGYELWAFIPPDMLGNLPNLHSSVHSFFVDATPSVYIYDHNNNGTIEPSSPENDKVILVFGERRGGGSDAAPTSGSYYSLDVSNPAQPKLLWRISNQSTGFEKLAETWSEPKLVKMKIGTTEKIVAFVGAGYDNVHEDTRYGNTRTFSDAASVSQTDIGDGDVVSAGSTLPSALTSPRGSGVYAIEIATLGSGGPSLSNSGTKIWGYTSADNSNMRFSIPSEIAALDADNDGYTDTLYVGDSGGQVWRFNVRDTTVGNWSAKLLYDLSSGAGRKFFYRPSVVAEVGYNMLFMGSGDREHPLNRHGSLVDRFYALKDKKSAQPTGVLAESSLTDVTTDQLQAASGSGVTTAVSSVLNALSTSYGWFIQLNDYQHNSTSSLGEKVLASPTVINKVAYFTTYTPTAGVVTNACTVGNLGTAALYAVDYKTGEAVLDYDRTNNSSAFLTNNTRAGTSAGQILLRSDREQTIGSGLASGIVTSISAGGDLKALIGVGGVIATENLKKGGLVVPLYWRRK